MSELCQSGSKVLRTTTPTPVQPKEHCCRQCTKEGHYVQSNNCTQHGISKIHAHGMYKPTATNRRPSKAGKQYIHACLSTPPAPLRHERWTNNTKQPRKTCTKARKGSTSSARCNCKHHGKSRKQIEEHSRQTCKKRQQEKRQNQAGCTVKRSSLGKAAAHHPVKHPPKFLLQNLS